MPIKGPLAAATVLAAYFCILLAAYSLYAQLFFESTLYGYSGTIWHEQKSIFLAVFTVTEIHAIQGPYVVLESSWFSTALCASISLALFAYLYKCRKSENAG